MRKYSLNESYFDDIDTADKAYFLGYLMADGYNDEKRGVVEAAWSNLDQDNSPTLRYWIV